jgi:alpha-beta hydrolase superfamily lysophospholipase
MEIRLEYKSTVHTMASSTASSTAYVLVPGGHCPGSFFHKVTERLRIMGFEVVEINHPSVGNPEKPPATMSDDAANILSAAASFMDQGKNVVVVANSCGGFAATEAMKGLSESERKAAGKSGGQLINLVYLASLLPPLGITCSQLIAGVVEVAEIHIQTDKDFRDLHPLKQV